MRITEEDLKGLKASADNLLLETDSFKVNAQSAAYLSVETIRQLKVNTRNNIMFIILGAVLGFIGSISTTAINEGSRKMEVKELHNQLIEVKTQLSNFQKYHSKKDSLKTFYKKN